MNITRTDVLIVGGGSAGLWAAHRFAEMAPECSVCIVDKGPRDWGGLMAMAGGDFDAVMPDENVDDWLKDLVYYFDGLCDQPFMETVLTQSIERMNDYQKFGCEFLRNDAGVLKSVPQRGLAHVKLYPAKLKGRGGELMVKNLVARLKDAKVQRMGRIMLNRYLVRDGRVCGAVGFDSISGEFHVFLARAVIAATGMGGWKTSYGKNTPTGEGALMAYNIGAVMQDFEFSRVWNMPRQFGWEGQTHLMAMGARFVNNKNESFMERYSPVLGPNTDPHFTTIAMAMEIRAGRGPLVLDVSELKVRDKAILIPQTGWQKLNYDKLCALGLDIYRDKTEWVPQMTVSHGGISADINGRTNIEGLFAAGTARSIEPGVYAGGFALMTTSVTGYRAGEAVAKWLADGNVAPLEPSPAELNALRDEVFAPLHRTVKTALSPKAVLTNIQATVFPYDVSILKTEKSLKRALAELQRIRAEEVPAMVADCPHNLLKLREVEAVAFVSELFVRASLERRECRAGQFREDCPGRDPKGLAWLCLQKQAHGEDPDFSWKPVPIESYKYPVEKFYQDNFHFANKG